MKETRQFVAYTADVEGSDIQTLSFPGIRDIKGVRIIASSGVTNGASVAHARIGVGYWDGSTHRAMSIQASDNDSTPNCGTRHDTATIVYFINTVNTNIVAEAEVSSVGAEFVKLHWSDYPGTALLLEVTVYYGSSVSCNLHSFTGHATAGSSQTKTGLSFAPNCLEVLHINGTAFAADSSFTTSALGIGFSCEQSDGTTILQACSTITDRNLPSTGQTESGQVIRNDAVAQKVTVAADGTVTAGARWNVTDYTSDGYTIQTVGVSEALTNVVFAVRYGTGERWVGVPSIANASTGSKSIATSPNFQPHHVDAVATAIDTANTVYDANSAGVRDITRLSIGSGRVVTQCMANWRSVSSVLPSVASATANTTLIEPGSWVASLTDFTSTGFDINVSSAADTTARLALFLAIGGSQALAHSFNESVSISEGQVLLPQHLAVVGETVQISDAQVLVQGSFALSEDVTISDDQALAVSAFLVDETVSISEGAVFASSAILAEETVQIAEDIVLVQATSNDEILVVDETVEISDAVVLAQQWIQEVAETVEISDGQVLIHSAFQANEDVEILEGVVFHGEGTLATVNESVEVSDAVVAHLGEVLRADETVSIADDFTFGAGAIARKTPRSRNNTLQGGAEFGNTAQGGAVKGGTAS